MRRAAAVLCVVGLLGLVVAAAASADPSGSKNSFTMKATCDNGMKVPVVVNSANGQGAGSQDNNTAVWAPAHVVGSPLVFHPTTFDLTFTFTPVEGPSQMFQQQASRLSGKSQTTCTLDGSQSDPAGDTFSISGTVSGWLS